MSIIEIWLLAIALAMDCFTVSIAAGLSARKIILFPMITMILLFGLFQGGMTWIGYIGTSLFYQYFTSIDHWIAFALLSYLGGNMIWGSLHPENEHGGEILCYRKLPTLAIATSIDALAVGISFACMESMTQNSILIPVIIIGVCSSLFTILGLGIGIVAGKKLNLNVELIGGIILISIGIKILIEHLFSL